MKSENKSRNEKTKKWFALGMATIAVAYLGIVAPLTHVDATKRIINNLVYGTQISCVTPSQNNEQKNMVLVSPGAGFYIDDNTGEYAPASAQNIRSRALAIKYIEEVKVHPGLKVVIQDGVLPPDMTEDIVVPIFKNYVHKESGGKIEIPDKDIYVDQTSINTASGMPILKSTMEKINADEAVFIDSQSHGNRTTEDACENGIRARWESAEEIVGNVDPAVAKANVKNPPVGTLGIRLKEKTEMALNIWFPGGWETVPAKHMVNAYKDIKKINNKSSPEYGHKLLPLAVIIMALMRLNKFKKQKAKKKSN